MKWTAHKERKRMWFSHLIHFRLSAALLGMCASVGAAARSKLFEIQEHPLSRSFRCIRLHISRPLRASTESCKRIARRIQKHVYESDRMSAFEVFFLNSLRPNYWNIFMLVLGASNVFHRLPNDGNWNAFFRLSHFALALHYYMFCECKFQWPYI